LVFGTVDILQGERAWQSGLISKSNFIIHPDYNRNTNVNNIGLIYVEDMPANLTDSRNVAIIDLPSEAEAKTDLIGKTAVISGYGARNDTKITDGILHHTTTQITTNDVCKVIIGYNVTDHNLCITPIGNSSVCTGDAGSAMTVEISSKQVLVGVSSIITNACTIGLPAVYENVFHHREWIYNTINGSSVVSVSFSLAAMMIMIVLRNFF
jgi:secreted trypsin-like serine protease